METAMIIAGGIILLAIIIGIAIIFHDKKKNRAIIRYESVTDKIAVREPEPEPKPKEDCTDYGRGFDLMGLATGIVVLGFILSIGLSILDILGDVVRQESFAEQVPEIVNIFPAIMTLGIIAIVLTVVGWMIMPIE